MDPTSLSLVHRLKAEEDIVAFAKILHQLRYDREISLTQIAKEVGKSPSYLSHLLRINKIPQMVIDGYYGGHLSATHLIALSRLETDEDIREVYERILRENLTLPRLDEIIREYKYGVVPDPHMIDPHMLRKTEKELTKILEAKVKIVQTRVRTRIIVEKRGSVMFTSTFIRNVIDKLRAPEVKPGEHLTPLE